MKENKNHGGKRIRSGRPKSEPTKLIRIPVRLEIEILRFIQDNPPSKN